MPERVCGFNSRSRHIMKLIIGVHAQIRMTERNISLKEIKLALKSPTKIEYDENNKLTVKKVTVKNGEIKLLLIVGAIQNNALKLITVIETSKVKKYL